VTRRASLGAVSTSGLILKNERTLRAGLYAFPDAPFIAGRYEPRLDGRIALVVEGEELFVDCVTQRVSCASRSFKSQLHQSPPSIQRGCFDDSHARTSGGVSSAQTRLSAMIVAALAIL
jgi:hypothetical protein